MAGIMDTMRRPFLKATMFESIAINFHFLFPKNFETSLKYVQINLVNLTAKGPIVSLQKLSLTKLKKRTHFTLEYSLKQSSYECFRSSYSGGSILRSRWKGVKCKRTFESTKYAALSVEERRVAWCGRCIRLVWRRCTSEILVLTFHSATKMLEPVLSLSLSFCVCVCFLSSLVTDRPPRRLTSTRFPPIVPNWDCLSFLFFPLLRSTKVERV